MIFVDTSFWYAFRVRTDRNHQLAIELFRTHGDDDLIVTSHVQCETWTLINRRFGHHAAVRFLDMLDQAARVGTIFVSDELEREAWRWLRQHDEREYSFVDATSFALMRMLGIREALAFDGDFAAAGFTELRA